ncbi:uncharacterized protein Z518_04183 [Rhinocladiella mackenziei CBS 650.93]|uniref:Uncharacterized protein n=1 Tax=Rhinocladiella mackenziei CBS 650.93 TaxID=1442369 RepID=A0A0D2H723_9EURO|nr:uncharacterized protein Z518_04183 [Rhinocladiella mackenziei CBS 650.93]KIX06208.1 hypothetical protein Z518_04183 [Rhinocladiella mackenziei CBS 650.93]
MTIHKQYPPRNYETFPEDTPSDSLTQSPASYHRGDADKTRSAAAEAQRLGSQGSWADNFAGGTPATNRTPTASTVDGDEVRDVQYPHLPQEPDPSDPPPVYTPSDTTQAHSQSPATAASPVVTRSGPISEPVSAPVTASSSSQSQAQRPYRDEDDNASSCLPEPVQHQHHHHDDEEVVDSLPAFMQSSDNCSSRRWCGGRRLCRALSKDPRSEFPNFGSQPSSSPWPVPKREHREHKTYRSITGTYQLYDLLDLSTTSGSISITVDVRPGDKPAVLRLATMTGSVHVRMTSGGGLFHKPYVSEPARTRVLMTEISTQTGSVSGDVVHGNGGSTSLSTRTGSLSLTVYTVSVSEQNPVSNFSTSTHHGSQSVRVLAPLTSNEAVRAIEAKHTVHGSGSMSIRYPVEWEGMVHLQTRGTGSVNAHGRDLIVQREGHSELYGYRGSKKGKTIEILEMGSGSINFQC